MAINNVFGNMLGGGYGTTQPVAKQPYTRMSGPASGLGQKQPTTCPTGYRYDTMQGKCVPSRQMQPGFWNQVQKGVQQATTPSTGQGTKPQAPQFMPQPMAKPNQLSPYAQLMAQAIDLHPPLAQVQQPYVQMQPTVTNTFPSQPINDQISRDMQFRRLLMGGM
jgi:hypothetical protein